MTDRPADGSPGQYRRLYDAAPVPIGVFTAAGIVYANRAAVTFFGADDRRDLLGRSPSEFLKPDDRDRIGLRIRRLIEDREATEPMEEHLMGLDDVERVAVVSSVPVTYEGEPAAQVVMNDVTEYQRTLSELERYKTIIETVQDGIYALDEELRFSFVNDALCDLVGRSREEFIGVDARSLFNDPTDRADADAVRRRLLQGEEDVGRVEGTLPTPRGERTMESRYRLYPEPEDGEFRGSVGVIRDVTAVRRLERELREEHRFVQNVIDALDDVLYVIDEDEDLLLWNEVVPERFGYTDREIADLDPIDFVHSTVDGRPPTEPVSLFDLPNRRDLNLVTKDGEVIPHEMHEVNYRDGETGERYRVGIGRDITDRLDREHTLQEQRDALSTLDRINELLFDVINELLEPTARSDVERTLCERLAASDRYRFAWVGEPAFESDRIVPRTAAGDDDGYLEAIAVDDDGAIAPDGPADRAIRTGEVQVVSIDAPADEPWQTAAIERGIAAVLAVPLLHRDTVYGVLAVYATDPDPVGDREWRSFAVLGETVGHAINAINRRRLLFADAVTELEFRITHADSVLARVSDRFDCRVSVPGLVSVDDRWILYVEAGGVSTDRILETTADDPAVERVRAIDEDGATGRLEMIMAPSSVIHRVVDIGVQIRSIEFDGGTGHVVVEAPAEADLRGLVEQLRAAFDTVELLAHRDRDRPLRRAAPPGDDGALTDRQREVLETAFRAGYFEWPRASTAEEVAETLDIASATFHAHIRKAEAALIDALVG